VQCTGNWAGAQGGNRNPDGGIETKSTFTLHPGNTWTIGFGFASTARWKVAGGGPRGDWLLPEQNSSLN